MKSIKKYNLFILFSSFTKGLIEVFVPLLLYKNGFSIKSILVFLLLKYFLTFIFIRIISKLLKLINIKYLLLLSSFLFILNFIYLKNIELSSSYLLILSFLSSSYLILYWVGRHTYALSLIDTKDTTSSSFSIMIYNTFGLLISSFIGAYVLNHLGYNILLIIISIFSLLSLIPLFLIHEEIKTTSIDIRQVYELFPKRNYLFLFLSEIKFISFTLFPLYIFLNISSNFEYIGILSIITNISCIIYIYILSKILKKTKKDYLSLISILLSITWILKLIIKSNIIYIIIVFLEGVFLVLEDTIILRAKYILGERFDKISYTLFIEGASSLIRVLILFLFIVFQFNLIVIIIIGLISNVLSSFVKFKYDI
ncbi:MAG: hypothetical protein RSB41_04180 [Bacilli bacterium]